MKKWLQKLFTRKAEKTLANADNVLEETKELVVMGKEKINTITTILIIGTIVGITADMVSISVNLKTLKTIRRR